MNDNIVVRKGKSVRVQLGNCFEKEDGRLLNDYGSLGLSASNLFRATVRKVYFLNRMKKDSLEIHCIDMINKTISDLDAILPTSSLHPNRLNKIKIQDLAIPFFDDDSFEIPYPFAQLHRKNVESLSICKRIQSLTSIPRTLILQYRIPFLPEICLIIEQ